MAQQYCNNFYSEDDVENSILVVEKGKYIKQTLDSLKQQYNTLLLMKYQAELSYKQISILLGIPENTRDNFIL